VYKVGPYIILHVRELELAGEDRYDKVRLATRQGMEEGTADLRTEIAALRSDLAWARRSSLAAATTATERADAAAINQDMVKALMAADAYIHSQPGPLSPEAAGLCTQIVDAVDAALTAGISR